MRFVSCGVAGERRRGHCFPTTVPETTNSERYRFAKFGDTPGGAACPALAQPFAPNRSKSNALPPSQLRSSSCAEPPHARPPRSRDKIDLLACLLASRRVAPLIEDVFVCCTRTRFLRMYFHRVSSRHWPSPLHHHLLTKMLHVRHTSFTCSSMPWFNVDLYWFLSV